MIAAISHDAGGAEILSSWLRRCDEPYCLAIDGPATDIFLRKIGYHPLMPLAEAIKQSDWVLCSTSWQSSLERRAISLAKADGKKVVAFLDHWINFKERFQEGGVTVLPDEIWVGDVEAEKIARACLADVKILLKPNPYFEDLQLAIKKIQKASSDSTKCSVLYVCEPIREHALLQYGNERYWGYTEEDALSYFLQNINALGFAVSKVKIRPHPSESKSKYDWAIKVASLPIEIGGNKTLIEETVESDVVIGCESMAMVVGLLAKKKVISSIPPGGRACSLPHPQIGHLQSLLNDQQGVYHP
jgi:hypothetical protein